MPEDNEKLANAHWLVRVAGCDEEVAVYAAYVQTNVATHGDTIHTLSGGSDFQVTSLKNADHKIVFQAPAHAVVYVRRADVTGKVDRNAAPAQIRDLQAKLAGKPTPAQTMYYTTNVAAGVPGAAGLPQTFTVNVPAGGLA